MSGTAVTISTKTIDVNLYSRDSNSLKGLCMYQPLTIVNGCIWLMVGTYLSSSTTNNSALWADPPMVGIVGGGTAVTLSLIHIPSPRDRTRSRMPSSA